MLTIILILGILLTPLTAQNKDEKSFASSTGERPFAPASKFPDYYLSPGDKLEVRVLGQPQLDTSQTIAPDGSVSLPIMGRTIAAGQTLKAFQTQITREFSAFAPKTNVVILLTQRIIPVEEPKPIYVIIHNLKTNTFETKTAKTITEAKAIAGNYQGEIKAGDIINVDTGKAPDFWEDNWYKVLSGLAVATGIYNSLR